MKKTLRVLVLALLLMLLCTAATAEVQTFRCNTGTIVAQGETRMPYYTDYSSRFGEGKTQDDFIISYVAQTGKDIIVAKDGTITVPEDLPTGIYYMGITYKPKSYSKSKSFTHEVLVIAPVNKMDVSVEPIYMSVDGNKTVGAPIHYQALEYMTYDPDVISVTRGRSMSNTLVVTIKGVAPGKTELKLETYNGIVKVIPVEVVGPETKVEFASDHFYGYPGDVIDLGTDLGNGENGTKVTWNLRYDIKRNGKNYSVGTVYYDRFEAKEVGEYDLTISTGDGLSASTKISIYDRANCASIEMEHGGVTVGASKRIVLRDVAGNEIYRPMSITAGGSCATMQHDKITGVAEGAVTITVRNEDGSTLSKTFPVLKTPTIADRESISITLEIGESFDLIPDFGVPASECRYDFYNSGSHPEDDLYCARVEGSTIVAQAPGKGEVKVSLGNMYAYCYVTVPDSDKAIRIVLPEAPLGVGETFQLTVQDKTGKVYPATFTSWWGCVSVTQDGLMTGVKEGYYNVHATLADGRELNSVQVQVVQRPLWMTHPSMTVLFSDNTCRLGTISSDVGDMLWDDVTIEVADPTIATVANGTFQLHKAGSTVVTLTAIHGGASTSFTLEVLESEKLFIGAGSIRVPYGYMMQLPQVTNAKGEVVEVTWAITHDVPGEGNPAESGFVLETDTIACVWPFASCELTGTSAKGEKVKLTVQGYFIVEEIQLSQTAIKLDVNRTAELWLLWDESAGETGEIAWAVENPTVVQIYGAQDSTPHIITVQGIKPGTSKVAAMLGNGAYAECIVTVYDADARIPGDANEDETVDLYDALLIMQYQAGWNLSINGRAADVNADGKVTIEDAILILQFDSGLDVELKQYIPAP